MSASRNDIKALAKERHPTANTVVLKRLSDFHTIGIVGSDASEPDWLLTISGGGDTVDYKAHSLDELHAMLIAEQGVEAAS